MSTLNRLSLFSLIVISLSMAGCYVEDPGPRQETERAFSVVDFDRLEIGSALHIDVKYGSYYSVVARGDRRNVNDLIVEKKGSTLEVRFDKSRSRKHDTFIEITSPDIRSVTFSGASDSKVYGFTANKFDVYLSGASVCQVNIECSEIKAVLTGGSYLNLKGEADRLSADLSGASALKAFGFQASFGDVLLSGASDGQVSVADELTVKASGASHLTYRGTPQLSIDVSGASSVQRD